MRTFVDAQSITQMPQGLLVRGGQNFGIDSFPGRLCLHLLEHHLAKLSHRQAVTNLLSGQHLRFERSAPLIFKNELSTAFSNRAVGIDSVFPPAQR